MDYISRATQFCEAIHPSGIAHPVDSWSNAVFLIAGGVIAWIVNKQKATSQFAARWGYFYAGIVALLGLTSFWNHATLSRAGGTADVANMFLLATFLILYGISRLVSIKQSAVIGLLILINIPLVYIASLPGSITDYIFAFLILVVVSLEIIIYFSRRYVTTIAYFWWALITLLVAYSIWQLDVRGIWCNPTSLIQGHAFWHLFSATAAGLFYANLASEKSRNTV